MSVFPVCAFLLLSIERLLYGWVYHFPLRFVSLLKGYDKDLSNSGIAPLVRQHVIRYEDKELCLWRCFMQLGKFVKVFQFSVIGYDLLLRCSNANVNALLFGAGSLDLKSLGFGVLLLIVGQTLNVATFHAIGAKGVYYGAQLGYEIPWCTSFPYNMGIGDPQYWGVVICIWGVYLMLGTDSWLVPVYETFWYVMSMKLLEDSKNGGKVLQSLGIREEKAA